jgi:oxygen-dependent protoporphyrinogen oxidase
VTKRAKRRVIVIGAGVSGLAAAHRLLELEPSIDLTVLEASDAPGGWLRTLVQDDFVIELGPDSILTEKPHALALVKRLELEYRLVSTNTEKRGAYVVSKGRLERVPEGFAMMAPTSPLPFLASNIISPLAKMRAGLELLIPSRTGSDEESLARFVTRRFGSEILERLAQPLISGVYGSDAETLSLEATMPRFLQMERDKSSVLRAMHAQKSRSKENASGARYGLFVGFDRGMQVMIDALAKRIGERLETRKSVRSIERSGARWRVRFESGESRTCDAVIVALPAHRIASILRAGGMNDGLIDGLDAIPHGSAATVTFAFRRDEVPHALDAFGFVVPAVERRAVLASTWSSVKWPGRAPAGWELIRVFLGGPHDPDVLLREDDELVANAKRELKALMGISSAPAFTRVMRYPRAMPNYRVGHLERASAIEGRVSRIPGLALAGNSLRGVGIPDAIASGERAAERVKDYFESVSRPQKHGP